MRRMALATLDGMERVRGKGGRLEAKARPVAGQALWFRRDAPQNPA